jgi:hypothetical protein
MKRLIIGLLLAFAVAAQERETKFVELRNIDQRQIGNLLSPFDVQWSGTASTIVLSGSPAKVAAAEAFLRKIDVPRRNIEAVFYIVAAGQKAGASGPLPPELEPVVKQLRSTFVYQSFRLLESAVARARENGDLTATGILPSTDPNAQQRTYSISADRVSIGATEKGNLIRFDKLRFNVTVLDMVKSNLAKKPEYTYTGLSADIDVREGQKVVVGKSNFDTSDGTYFVIVTAKVVD